MRKRIAILSDTHSCLDEAIVRNLRGFDEIWHAGDIGDFGTLRRLHRLAPVLRAVCGNIDHGDVVRMCPRRLLFDCAGARVCITHIGGYPGKYAPGIANFLRNNGVTIFVDGHSHILKVMPDQRLGLLHINPGAAGVQGWQRVRTIVHLEIENGTPCALEVVELNTSNEKKQ